MQSDPENDRWPLPDSRDGAPLNPDDEGSVTLPGGPVPEPPALAPAGSDSSSPSNAPPSPGMPGPADAAIPPTVSMPPAGEVPGSAPEGVSWPQPRSGAAPIESGREGAPVDEAEKPPTQAPGEVGAPAEYLDAAASPAIEAHDAESAPGVVTTAAVAQGDWLASVCPYLVSEDGTYRSAQPDEGHRCTAQDPPGTLPLAFQERFCLTDRHDRCEMFKYAQEAGVAGDIPAATAAPAATKAAARASGGKSDSQKPLLVAAAGMGGVIIIVLLVLLLGSCSSDPATPVDGASPEPGVTADAESTSKPQPTPAPAASEVEVDPDATPLVTEAPLPEEVAILYEVQEGEKLLAIAETFGTTRRNIIRANEGMEDKRPYVETGDRIVVLISSEMTVEELEDIPGYQGPAE